MIRRGVTVAVLLLVGCGGPSDGFLRAKTAGDRAKTSGRYDEAARSYQDAAAAAKSPHERDEAMYLAAATWAQAGRTDEAMKVFEALVAKSPHGERSDRAAFDRAFLEIERGSEARGYELLEQAMLERPTNGTARRALRKLVDHANQPAGVGMAWLDARMDRLQKTELAEDAKYLRAGLLAEAGRLAEARDAYVRCAEQHPYPGGSLADDAWYHAAELDLKLGDANKAVDDLKRLLSPRESSTLGQGSYERPRYSPAQMKIAQIYRDVLHDEKAARDAFHALYANHPTSVLRGEALFEEARLAKKAGDRDGACDAVARFAKDKELEESRYAGCASVLCENAKPPAKAPPCRAYLRDRIDGKPPQAPEEPAPLALAQATPPAERNRTAKAPRTPRERSTPWRSWRLGGCPGSARWRGE